MLLLDGFEKYIEENELFTHDDKILLTVSARAKDRRLLTLKLPSREQDAVIFNESPNHS
jgi:hypothetical protein